MRAIVKAEPLRTVWEVARELNVNHSMVIQHLKQIGKVKKLNKWVRHELTANQKNCHFEMLSSTQQWELFLDWIVICDWKVDFIWQPAVASSVVGLRRCYKPLPKAELKATIGHGHYLVSAASLIHCSFLNPRETTISEKYAQQIDEMPWKLQCLQPTLVNRKSPVLHNNTWLHVAQSALKSWANWAKKFCLICHIHLTSPAWLPLLQAPQQLFAGNMLLQPAGGRKCFPRVCWILKHGFLCYRIKQTYFLLAKMYWL